MTDSAGTSTATAAAPKRRWLRRLLVVAGVLVLLGVAISAFAFFSWTDWREATAAEADAAFAAARAALGADPPYVEVLGEDRFVLHREQQPAQPDAIGRLRALIWTEEKDVLVELDVPFWFLRWKSGAMFGLDEVLNEVVSEASGRTNVSLADLEARGPGLYLDWTFPEGRALLWGEP
jgi:hypothetical protein